MVNTTPSSIEHFARSLRNYRRVLLTTHHLPDGDGLGSEIALLYGLRKLGLETHAINSSATPDKFRFIDPRSELRIYQVGNPLPKVDAVVVVDTSDVKMLGPLQTPLVGLGVPILFIDHHVHQASTQPSRNLIDESYSSTGELTFALLEALGIDLDPEMAIGIYVALVTDTESFRFRRTSPRSHRTAAVLLSHGVRPEEVYRQIYANDSVEKLRLLGHVLETSTFSADGRVGWLIITKEQRLRYGATVEDTESFVSHLTRVKGVEVAMLFREDDDGRIKVSLRGNGEIPVFEVAHHFGGGGHRYSAGVRISGSLEETVRSVVSAAEAAVRERR